MGDPPKAKARLRWEPQVDFEQLVRMMVDNDLSEQKLLADR